MKVLDAIIPAVRGVAQPGSALAWGARGRKFESSRPDQESGKGAFQASFFYQAGLVAIIGNR